MGTPACILMPRVEYTPEKLLADAIVSSFRADLGFYFSNTKIYENGCFKYTTFTIRDESNKEKNDKAFFCYVYSKEKRLDESFTEYEDVGLEPSLELCRVGYIEDIYWGKEIIFRFFYEYLKINPGHYFWLPDYDWVYTWEDMQKLKSLPYDDYWCYKNPKTGEFEE